MSRKKRILLSTILVLTVIVTAFCTIKENANGQSLFIPVTKKELQIPEVQIPELNYEVEWKNQKYTVKTKDLSIATAGDYITGKTQLIKDGAILFETEFLVWYHPHPLVKSKEYKEWFEGLNKKLINKNSVKMTERNLKRFFSKIYHTYFNLLEKVYKEHIKPFYTS